MIDEDEQNDPFIAAWEAREANEIKDSLAPIFWRHGHGNAPEGSRAAANAERHRVDAMLARSRVDRSEADARYMAEIQVASGHLGNLDDTFIRPTSEWMGKGETRNYFPRQRNDTARVVRTVRRVLTPIVQRMNRRGEISDDALRACLWYRNVHELAKLDGRFSTTHFSDPNGAAANRRTGGTGGHIPMTIVEAEARRAFRGAQAALPDRYRAIFDKIVLDDVPIYRAALIQKSRRSAVRQVFCRMAEQLARYREANDLDLNMIDRG